MSSKSQHICLVVWNQRTNNNFGRELSTMQRESTPTSRTVNANATPRATMANDRIGSVYVKNTNYLLVVDYYSRYVEVITLRGKTSSKSVIAALKTMFARHGIPDELRSDNGPQYHSDEFAQFASDWGFRHTTSRPRYPQSNGQAERAVRTVKDILRKENEPAKALLAY